MSRGILERIAGAPITWGVDGSPGWGHLMEPDRVLAEMVEVGLKATELGPDGYLGASPDEVIRRLDRHGLQLVGGFVPVVLYDGERVERELDYFERASTTLASGGASIAVVGADSELPGYDQQIHLDDGQWNTFFQNLDRLTGISDRCGVTVAVHPHWGMAVQDQADVDLLLERSNIGFCLDTGHLALAEVDIPSFVARAGDRIHHVHLKDLDPDFARRVRAGEVGFRQAVIDGMFKPLGEGGVDIAGTILDLERSGFGGWYVLEQDVSLVDDPAPGSGPIEAAIRSIEFLRKLAGRVSTSREGAAG
jgi:inosose dehydratase